MAIFKFKPDNKVINILRIIKNVFFAVILTIFALVLVFTMISRISGKAPSIMGYSVYRVTSGSMKPALQVGNVILSKSCGKNELNIGDIVTYMGRSGDFDGKIVTHRIVKAPYYESGAYYIVTKGDNNPSNDSPVLLDDVLGKMQNKLSFISAIYDFFITPWGLIAIILLIIAAFFNEIIIFIKNLIGFKDEDEANLEKIIERYKKEQETEKQQQISENNENESES
jgi:signal peptidase